MNLSMNRRKAIILAAIIVVALAIGGVLIYRHVHSSGTITTVVNGRRITIKEPPKNTPGVVEVRRISNQDDVAKVQADIEYYKSLIPTEYRQ